MDQKIAYFRLFAILILLLGVGGVMWFGVMDIAPPVEEVEIILPVDQR